jgi:dienelactone hydrolase
MPRCYRLQICPGEGIVRAHRRGGSFRVAGALALVVAIGAGLVATTSPAGAADPVRYLDPVFPNVTVTKDITYGLAVNASGALQSLELDLYEPTGDTEQQRPVFVWAHGGFFTQGNKSEIGTIGPFMAQRGYVVLSIEYRLNPALPQGLEGYSASEQLPYDLALLVETIRDGQHDMQAAVRWARANAVARRLDPTRIATGGFSAGATMSMAVAYNSDDPGASGNPGHSSSVTAAIGTGTLNAPLFDIHPDPLVEPPVAMFHGQLDESPVLGPIATCLVAQVMLNVCEVHQYAGEGHSSRNGINDWPAFLYTWVIQKTAPPLSLPQGTLPTIPAVRVPSSLVPKNLIPGLPI